ncbi:hypothetical protein BC629DRAFT_1442040 [Irpex lacteus]|nr:hypothetical protein BC629DRAFT_1442040 [Irpex lacteus]
MIHGRLTFKLPPSVGQTEPEIFELVHWMCSGLQKLLLSGVIPPQGPGEASAVNSVWRLTFEFDSISEEALRLLRAPVLAAGYRSSIFDTQSGLFDSHPELPARHERLLQAAQLPVREEAGPDSIGVIGDADLLVTCPFGQVASLYAVAGGGQRV